VVGGGHLLFGEEVGGVAQTADQEAGACAAAQIDGESGVGGHLHGRISCVEVMNPLRPLFHGEKVLFLDVIADGDDNLVEKRQGFGDNLLVTLGERAEGTGENSDLFHGVCQSLMMVKL